MYEPPDLSTPEAAAHAVVMLDRLLATLESHRLFRFLVRASRDLWAFLLGEGRFPRHSHLSPEDPSHSRAVKVLINHLQEKKRRLAL